MEKLDWKANSTQAKSIGTLVSIAGALIITLYKGQAVIKNHPSNKLFPKKHVSSEQFDWTWIIRNYLAELVIAIIGVSLRSIVHIWVMSKKGPLYVAMFKPIGIIFAVIIGIAFLGDSIYLGSVLGTAIVVIGFYAIIWGKSQEQAKEECKVYDDSESYSPIVPLLENKRMEE
uniref:WAT1-related protein n=1 Tax=Glycine max TaxID=3847 RepID=A0A0R0HCN0_SOYBN